MPESINITDITTLYEVIAEYRDPESGRDPRSVFLCKSKFFVGKYVIYGSLGDYVDAFREYFVLGYYNDLFSEDPETEARAHFERVVQTIKRHWTINGL